MAVIHKLMIIGVLGLLLCSCEATVAWTGQTYTGTITKDSQKGVYIKYKNIESVYEYHEMYDVGCAGEWTIEVESLDGVNIYIEAKQNGCENAQTLLATGTSDKIRFTHKFDQPFRLYLKVLEDEVVWNNNGCSARYSISLEIK